MITSKDNEQIKQIKKLKEKKYRDIENSFILEGLKVIKEAIVENAKIKKIVVTEENEGLEFLDEIIIKNEIEFIVVSDQVFKSISNVDSPQGILAVIEKVSKKIDLDVDLILALDTIQDPGNLGTIIRTLDSINLKQVIISKGTVDPYNEKVLRATMGSIFRVNVIEVDNLEEKLKEIKTNGFKIVSTSLDTETTIYTLDYAKSVLVMGNESKGVSKEVLSISDEKVKIPMSGKLDSLNVSVSTGIILYEYMRRS